VKRTTCAHRWSKFYFGETQLPPEGSAVATDPVSVTRLTSVSRTPII